MGNISLNSIIKKYSIESIEKQLILQYLTYNCIDYKRNLFLTDYFNGYIINPNLGKEIEILGHNTLEEIAVDMELLIPSEDKKVNGAFFTPSYIVDYIIETISPNKEDKVIDLSCGSGAFLLGLARYYKNKHNKNVSDCIKDNIYGADILGYNTIRCKLILTLFALSNNENISVDNINVIQCDSLKHNWECNFDAVIGNPPYVKFQDMEDSTRDYLMKEWRTTQYGTFNLYFAFFELGLRLLTTNGKLGYITPNNYFTSLSGECLRGFFQSSRCIYKIIDFNSTKVFNVQTYTSITFANKLQNENINYARIGNNESPIDFLVNAQFTPNNYNLLNEKKWRLLCGCERENIYHIENNGTALGELFNICVGIATLKDEVYFIDPLSEDDRYYTISRLGNIYKIEKNITRSVVKISDMKTQMDITKNQKRIIFPYITQKGKPIAIEEETMKTDYPFCYEYLLSVKDILEGRGKGKHKYSPFYAYGRTQGLNRVGVKLLTPTFSKYPRFLYDNNEDSMFTNGYGIYLLPNQELSLFDTNPITTKENIDVLQKLLNSIVMHYYVKKTSVSIEGGYPCYQKNFIERFTIPNLSDEDIANLRKMNKVDTDKYLIEKYHLNLLGENLSE